MARVCKGGCKRSVGSGCGCCSDDFPEMYGYCSTCFPASDAYTELTQNVKAVLDRLDLGGCVAFKALLDTWDCDFERIYLELTEGKISALRPGDTSDA